MDKLDYRKLVRSILEGHGKNHLDGNTEVQLIFDRESDRYQLLHIG
jgi:XisI protein